MWITRCVIYSSMLFNFCYLFRGVCNKNEKYRTRFENEKYSIGRLNDLLRHTFRFIYFRVPKI